MLTGEFYLHVYIYGNIILKNIIVKYIHFVTFYTYILVVRWLVCQSIKPIKIKFTRRLTACAKVTVTGLQHVYIYMYMALVPSRKHSLYIHRDERMSEEVLCTHRTILRPFAHYLKAKLSAINIDLKKILNVI